MNETKPVINLQHLTNEHLLTNFRNLVTTERKLTRRVLDYICEIDAREIYLEKAYSSLFEYLVNEFGYSAGAAMRRIDGARLLRDIPEVAVAIETGTIHLSQLNQLQRAAREVRKNDKAPLTVEHKKELLRKIENQTQKQTEQILATELSLPTPAPFEKERVHRDNSVTMTLTFTAEQIEILERAQNVMSHSVPQKNWALLITYLAKKELSRRLGLKLSEVS